MKKHEQRAYSEAWEGNLEEAIKDIRDFFRSYGIKQRERENFMISQFPIAIKEIVDTYPELKVRSKIRVLINLGSTHTAVYHFLKRQGYDTKRINSGEPPYAYFHQAVIKSMWGNDVNDFLASRVLFEDIIALSFDFAGKGLDQNKLEKYMRKLLSEFSFEEIQEIFRQIKTFSNIEQFNTYFVEACKRKGLRVPRSNDDLDIKV